MSSSVCRRAAENAYGYNFSTSNWMEEPNGKFYEDCGMGAPGLWKVMGDLYQAATYIPLLSSPLGIIGCGTEIFKMVKTKKATGQYFEDKNEKVFAIARLSRSVLSGLGLGFLAAPADIALTVSRVARTKRECPKFYS